MYLPFNVYNSLGLFCSMHVQCTYSYRIQNTYSLYRPHTLNMETMYKQLLNPVFFKSLVEGATSTVSELIWKDWTSLHIWSRCLYDTDITSPVILVAILYSSMDIGKNERRWSRLLNNKLNNTRQATHPQNWPITLHYDSLTS